VYRVHAANMHHAYSRERQLPDLTQRKAAVDAVFDPGASPFSARPDLHRSLLAPLANDAVAYADAAFDAGDAELSARLIDFASEANPRLRSTVRWWRLQTKHALGVARAQRISAWLARARRLAAAGAAR